MTDIAIRESRDDDVPALAAIYAHHVRHGLASFELEPPSLEEFAARRAAILARGDPYLVADAGMPVGYAHAGAWRPRPAYRFAVENSIYVAPDRARQGIGRRLLPALIAACEARGFRQMVAVIGDSANHASIGLHAAFGFVHAGTLAAIGWKHGRWVDSVLMQRALGQGAAAPPAERAAP